MSKNLDFTLEKRGKNFILKCGKNEVALDPTKAWKQQIFKEPSGIPFVSDGKVSERCVNIFQKHEEAEAAAEVEGKPKDEKASSSSKVEQRQHQGHPRHWQGHQRQQHQQNKKAQCLSPNMITMQTIRVKHC